MADLPRGASGAPYSPRYAVEYGSDRPAEFRDWFGGDCWHLVDTTTGRTVWSDGGEPEDMTLCRDLSELVDMLNTLAALVDTTTPQGPLEDSDE